MRALVIIHWQDTDIDLILRLAAERQIHVTVRNPSAGESCLPSDEFDTIICMGGPQTAAGELESYLYEEIECLRSAVAEGKPVLGICLGAQLLARALGGEVSVGDAGVEAGYIDVWSDTSTTNDCHVSGRFFSFHSDTFTPPPGATLLASSSRYPQAWSHGLALGLQFHPELSVDGITKILDIEDEKLERSGVDVNSVRTEAEKYAAQAVGPGRDLLERWFDGLKAAPRKQSVVTS